MSARRQLATAATLMGLVLLAGTPAAQPAGKVYVIEKARIVPLAGPVIESGSVVVRDGTIAAVGATVQAPAGAERIDATGLHVYPGLFDAVTQLGLTEVGAVSATVDTTEAVPYNPQLVAAAAVHPPSDHLPVTRANGITHAVAVPGVSGGTGGGGGRSTVIAGQASAIHLSGWTVEEMLIAPSVGMVVNWPALTTGSFDTSTFSVRQRPYSEVKQEYDRRVTELGEWLDQARRYRLAMEKAPAATSRDLKLEALARVVGGELPLLVTANRRRQIRDAVDFAVQHRVRLVLLGGDEARSVADLLVKHKIPVILGPTQAMPAHEDDPYDDAYTLAGDLHKAGVAVSISTFNSADSRTLPYEAGHAVGFGLPWEEGLKAITINPARALGLDARLGTIEPGKVANLIVTTGDPLEITTDVRHVFIAGQPVSLENRHQRSYLRWKSRPRPAPAKP